MSTPQFNMDLISGMSIDDIDDLPGFEAPVPGMYSLKFSTSTKVVKMKAGDTDCVEANFEVIECLEQNDPAQEPTKAGTKFSVLFQMGQEVAMGKLKELLMPIAKHFNESNIGVLITETCKDLIITAKVARRADKEDKEKFYPVVTNVTVA